MGVIKCSPLIICHSLDRKISYSVVGPGAAALAFPRDFFLGCASRRSEEILPSSPRFLNKAHIASALSKV